MSDKLKSCPFCGGEATIFQLSHSDSGGYDHPCEVGCVKCGIVMKRRFKTDDLYHGYPTDEEHEQVDCETIKAWNTRAEQSWTDVLAELHERFDALEKEIRKASAEMSAIIREYVDRPKGEQIAIGAVCEVICKHCIKANGDCQHHWKCPLLTEIAELMEPKDEPQTERSRRDEKNKILC